MIRQSVSLSNTGQSDPIRLDARQVDFNALALIVISNTATVTAQFTADVPETDPNNPTTAADNWVNATWYPITDLTDATATTSANIDTNVEAIRIDCTAHTAGTITLKAIQGDA